MKTGKSKWAVVLLACLLLCTATLGQAGRSEEANIRHAVEQYDNALNHKDVAGIEHIVAPNYAYFSSKGEMRSRQSLLNELLSPNYKLASAARMEVSVYQTGDTAVASSRWKGEGISEGQPFHDDQRCSIVLGRDRQQWQVLAEHCTQIVAP